MNVLIKRLRNSYFIEALRKSTKIRLFLRQVKMAYFRKIYGLSQVHSTFYMGGKSDVSSDLKAGPYSYMAVGCRVCPKVSIGSYTMFGPDVQIVGDDHTFSNPDLPVIFSGRPELKETFIGKDVWVGTKVIIKAGVKIGDGAIIAAGSIITKDIPERMIYGGVPAKFMKKRFEQDSDIKKHKKMLDKTIKDLSFPDNRT